MPPKQDVFADLFGGQKKQDKHAPMNQRMGVSPIPSISRLSPSLLVLSTGAVNLFNGLTALLQPQRLTNISQNDPFDIFNQSSSKPSVSSSSVDVLDDFFGSSAAATPSAPVSEKSYTPVSGLLLDDEFTDAFTPVAEAKPKRQQPQTQELPPRPTRQPESRPPPSRAPRQRDTTTSRQRDAVVAQLVDIGFDTATANDAISKKGEDVQACVNYIMAKAAGKENDDVLPQRPTRGEGPDVEQWLNKGMLMGFSLFNKANKQIRKNLDNFIDGNNNTTNDGMPAWMKLALQYKDHAHEKKYGGEDYGSDLENINEEEIQRVIRQQRDRDRVRRAEQRDENSRSSERQPTPPGDDHRIPQQRQQKPQPAREEYKRTAPPQKQPQKQPPRRNEPQEYNLPKRPQRKSASPASISNHSSLAENTPASPSPAAAPAPEVDLLGLSLATPSSSLRSTAPLNQFDETDYTTAKEAATKAYTAGDYTTALGHYETCLSRLPDTHELRVVIGSNLANVYKNVGSLKASIEVLDASIALIDAQNEVFVASLAQIGGKPVKYWFTKLVLAKAEVYELMERYEQSLEQYVLLVSRLAVSDRKVTDGKRRVDKVVNPENYKPKPAAKSVTKPTPKPPVAAKPRPSTKPPAEDARPSAEQADAIEEEITAWAHRKNDNLRGMLTNLEEIIPANIAMKPALRTLTLNELMLPKQVKIQYMKVISSIHPDKLASQCQGDPRAAWVCNSVFIRLNKAWEQFKVEENMS